MMRIAKIADEEGGGADTGGSLGGRAAVGAGGGLDAGRGGAVTGLSCGSEGERVVAGALGSLGSLALKPGFERRRGIGGGELSGATPPAVCNVGKLGSAGNSLAPLSLARLTVSTAPPSAE